MAGVSEQRKREVLMCIQSSNDATRTSPTKWEVKNPRRPPNVLDRSQLAGPDRLQMAKDSEEITPGIQIDSHQDLFTLGFYNRQQ